jgi:hypothetical protein
LKTKVWQKNFTKQVFHLVVLHRVKLVRYALFFCLLISLNADAQSIFTNSAIVARGHYGYIWAHREKVENIVTGHTTGFEISFQKQTNGSHWWQVVHGYPQTGISFVHLNLGNPELVGNANALLGYINLQFVRKKNFLLSMKVAAGLGYFSKRWQRDEYYQNLAIGSHINAAIQFIGETRYRISKKIFLNLNYGITHFSNGAYHVPNLGINNISLSGGAVYQFNEPEKYFSPEIPELNRHAHFVIIYGTGVKENYPPADKQFFAHTLYGSVIKPLTHTSSVGAGLDLFYDLSLRKVVEAETKGELRSKLFRMGLHGGYEMNVNKVTMLFHMGVYLYDKPKLDGNIFHRTGLKYAINENLFANLTLKTHYFRADLVELGLGWKFKKDTEKQ